MLVIVGMAPAKQQDVTHFLGENAAEHPGDIWLRVVNSLMDAKPTGRARVFGGNPEFSPECPAVSRGVDEAPFLRDAGDRASVRAVAQGIACLQQPLAPD